MNFKVYIDNQHDRDAVALALIHNSYTVKQGREKQGNKYVWFVQYER